jgi:hypothetical protein
VTTRPTAIPSRTFSPSRPLVETRPRVSRGNAFSSRSSASEPATRRTTTKARVRVAATAIAKISSGGLSPDQDLVDRDRLRQPGDQRLGDVEVVARLGGEAGDFLQRRLQSLRQRRGQRFEDLRARPQAEDVEAAAERLELAAVDDQVEVAAAFGADPPRHRQVRLREQRRDPVVDQFGLDRVFLVDEDFDFRHPRGQGRERVDLADEVGREDQRRQRVPGFHLSFGLGAVGDEDAFDPAADPALHVRGWKLRAPDRDPRPRRHFVQKGDPRLFRAARDREADEDRDQDRVGDQQHRLQGRAAEDLQVLQQQPADAVHQCPRWCR